MFEPAPGARAVPVLRPEALTPEVFEADWSHRHPFLLRGFALRWPASKAWAWRQLADPQGPYAPLKLAPLLPKFFPPSEQRATRDGLFLHNVLDKSPLLEECPMSSLTSQEAGKPGILGESFLPGINEAWKKAFSEAKAKKLVRKRMQQADAKANYFIAGPAGSGGSLHIDPEAQAFWNALIHGRKRWLFMRSEDLGKLSAAIKRAGPAVLEDVVKLVGRGTQLPKRYSCNAIRKLLQQISAWNWFGFLMPLLEKAGINFTRQEIVAKAGDVVYGPPGVFHIVLSLEDSVGCSEQLVDRGNVVQFVRNEEEDFEPVEAYMGCRVLNSSWPELARPLTAFCKRAEAMLREDKAKRGKKLKAQQQHLEL